MDNKAHLTLRLDGAFAPIHEDARVAIRPVSLLGERFVDLDRGTDSAPVLPDGGLIPATQTRRSVDLDEVLSAVDDPTGEALAALLVGLGGGLAGRRCGRRRGHRGARPRPHRHGRASCPPVGSERTPERVDRPRPARPQRTRRRPRRPPGRAGRQHEGPARHHGRGRPGTGRDFEAAPDGPGHGPERPDGTGRARRRDHPRAVVPAAPDGRPVRLRRRPQRVRRGGRPGPRLPGAGPGPGPGTHRGGPPGDRRPRSCRGRPPSRCRAGRQLSDSLPADLANLFDFVRNFALATSGSDGISHYLRFLPTPNQEDVDGRSPFEPPQSPIFGQPESAERPSVPAAPAPKVKGDAGSATGLTAEQERSLLEYLVGGGK